MQTLSTCVGRLTMLAIVVVIGVLLYRLGSAISNRWAVVTGAVSTRSTASAAGERRLFSIVTPTASPTSAPTATPTVAPSPTPFPTVPPLATLASTATPQSSGPFHIQGKIEKLDGSNWTIGGHDVVVPFSVTGRPRVGADADAQGIVRSDGVWEVKVITFSP